MRPVTMVLIWGAVLFFLVLLFMGMILLGGMQGLAVKPDDRLLAGIPENSYLGLLFFLWFCLVAGIYDLLYAVFRKFYAGRGIAVGPDPLGGVWKYAFLFLISFPFISGGNGAS